ncbi:putative lipoprotein signal peptide [Yersinia intermedia]|uniref:alpha/beta hydrolase family protein n=1 Tax=Yersinia intermedia TaxID=631 RepID=UPI0005EA5839|nr:alpha/beta fold hydrolase [Yersinia intermedia]MDA5513798.1 dienelactone hydrolase [Yersinia intermedia]CNI38088.1 putative lipoprotein signal peptide [Yersinia intermedia]CQE05909.1 putative lipoprotein signal peptide [Yersinia intermedia]
MNITKFPTTEECYVLPKSSKRPWIHLSKNIFPTNSTYLGIFGFEKKQKILIIRAIRQPDFGRIFLKFMSVIFFLMLHVAGVNAENTNGVGIKKLEVVNPIDHLPMETVAFFPSSGRSEVTSIGPYQIAASRSVSIGSNLYPLILLSHGNMGSMWGHHDLATALAQQGYIVVSVTHPGDNFQNSSLMGSTSTIYGRPLQISAALSAALKDSVLASHIDKDRIGFLGFSAGGTTGLILAGGKPTLTRLAEYCAKRPNDHHVCEAKGHIRLNRPELSPTADPRIRSFVLLAPLSVIFTPEGLQPIKAPLLIFVGDKDEELSPDDNAIALAKSTEAWLQVIPNAGHFTFLSPCSPDMNRTTPDLCAERKGIDRVAIHQRINVEITTFFDESFGIK